MSITFSLIVGVIIGWILHGYLPPEFVNTVNNTIANLSKKLTNTIAAITKIKTKAPVSLRAVDTQSGSSDDLDKIEGIGAKTMELLNHDGILTYADLASTSVDRLKSILEKGGSRYRRVDSSSWPEQALMAKKGDWTGLKELQRKRKDGRRTK